MQYTLYNSNDKNLIACSNVRIWNRLATKNICKLLKAGAPICAFKLWRSCREKPHLMRSSYLVFSNPFRLRGSSHIFLVEIFRQPVLDKYFRRHVHMRGTSSKNIVLFQKHVSLLSPLLFTCPNDTDNFDANLAYRYYNANLISYFFPLIVQKKRKT